MSDSPGFYYFWYNAAVPLCRLAAWLRRYYFTILKEDHPAMSFFTASTVWIAWFVVRQLSNFAFWMTINGTAWGRDGARKAGVR